MADMPCHLAAALGGKTKLTEYYKVGMHKPADFTTSGLLGKAVIIALYGDTGAGESPRQPVIDLKGNTVVEIMNTVGGSHSSNSSAVIYFIPKVTAELTIYFYKGSYSNAYDYCSIYIVE